MAKKIVTPGTPSKLVKAPTPKPPKPKAVEVDAPVIYKGEGGTLYPLDVKDEAYLTTDPNMDSSDIIVQVQVKDGGEPVFEDLVDTTGTSGARKIPIPLKYITSGMGHTLLFSYIGRVAGQPAQSRVSEVEVRFYDEKDLEGFVPKFVHSEVIHNTPTLDMRTFSGDETILAYGHPLIKEGDQLFVNVAGDQDKTPFAFNIVAFSRVVTAAEAVPGHVFRLSLPRRWMGNRRLWGSVTMHWGWICDGRFPLPPADVDPILETRLPENALEGRPRPTSALIVDPVIENLPPPHLRQSVEYNGGWHLNPELTKEGGDVDVPGLDTYAGDRVCFYVSGPGFAKKPLGCVAIEHDGDPASVKLPACIVACLFNQSMTLTYTLAFNESEQPSPDRVVNVLAPQFERAGIEEATNHTVDLRTFSGDATATVPAWAYGECSKLCWMWITGKREDGSDFKFDILTNAPVTNDWKTHGVDASIPRAELKELADCSSFELHFAATFCDADDLAEAHAFPAQAFEIEQEALVLLAPEVVEAVGPDLTAWNGRNGVQVKVDYAGNNPKHSISLCWKKVDGTCWPLASKPGSVAGAVIFELPAEAVIEGMGETVLITYTVTTACKVQSSLPLNLEISLPTRLETPNVLQATPPKTQNAVLDIGTFTGNADSHEDPMWFLPAGLKCWLRATGIDENGNPYTFVVYENRVITDEEVTKGVAGPVLRAALDKLKDDTDLILTFSVSTQGSMKENVVCPSRVLKVRVPPKIIYENFSDTPIPQLVYAGGRIETPRMSILHVSGAGTAGVAHYPYQASPDKYTAPGLMVGYNTTGPQVIRMNLKFSCVRTLFGMVWLDADVNFSFYDEQGVLQGSFTRYGQGMGGDVDQWVSFTAPSGGHFSSIVVATTTAEWVALDNFTFWLN